jgi:hypothetical protein
MKKLLFLLLLPLTLIAQDFKVGMNFGADANVGEEIELKFELFPPNGQTEMPATFLLFDVQWNNKLLEYVSHTFDPLQKLTGEQNNRSHWDGYKFNPDSNYSESNLHRQFLWWESGASNAGSTSYSTNADFSVNRYTIQASEDINLYDAVLTIKFRVLDRQGTNYQDYSNVFQISWANLRDNRDGTVHQLTSTNHQISLNPGGVGAGDVTINLDVPHSNKQDYGYSIYAFSQLEGQDYDNDGVIDAYFPKPDETPVADGNFNSSGVATVAGLVLDEYSWIHTHVNQSPTWLDDVVTVTDVYKIFQYSLDTDINGGGGIDWEYKIQDILGEVTNDGQVNFDDSYELLAHINGVTTSANVTSVANGAFNLSALMDVYGLLNGEDWHLFTPTDNNKSFTVGHGLRGDVDFSHTTVPTAAGSENAQQNASTSARMSIMQNRSVETHDLDIISRLENGKVIMEINLESEGLIGSQFTIKYDNTILTLDNVKFDTGNEMTNFATHREEQAKIYIGSLDQNGDVTIKPGLAYKLTFTPNESVQNTSGLVTFKLTEGVKADGTKVKFNIQ